MRINWNHAVSLREGSSKQALIQLQAAKVQEEANEFSLALANNHVSQYQLSNQIKRYQEELKHLENFCQDDSSPEPEIAKNRKVRIQEIIAGLQNQISQIKRLIQQNEAALNGLESLLNKLKETKANFELEEAVASQARSVQTFLDHIPSKERLPYLIYDMPAESSKTSFSRLAAAKIFSFFKPN